ncbi:hypothetical protein Tco_0426230 [Tanacetum coccineum]
MKIGRGGGERVGGRLGGEGGNTDRISGGDGWRAQEEGGGRRVEFRGGGWKEGRSDGEGDGVREEGGRSGEGEMEREGELTEEGDRGPLMWGALREWWGDGD